MSGLMKQRWLWVVVVFAVINSGGWVWVQQRLAANDHLNVISVALTDPELSNVPLTVHFDQMMAAGTAVGDELPEGWIEVQPAVSGRWEWSDARTARLRLDAPLVPATVYDVAVSERVVSLDGKALAKRFETTVSTTGLVVEQVTQTGYTAKGFTMSLSFNHRVDPAALARHLEVTDASGHVLFRDATIAGKASRQIKLTETRPGLQAPLTVRIGRELTAHESASGGPVGSIGLEADYTTVLTPDLSLGITRVYGSGDTIRFRANQLLDPAVIGSFIDLQPAVKFSVSHEYSSIYRLSGAFEAGQRYRVRFLPGMPSLHGQILTTEVSEEVTVGSTYPSLDFATPGLVLWGQGQRQVMLNARNVKEVEMVVRRVYPQNLMLYWNNRHDDSADYGEEVARTTIPVSGRRMTKQAIELPLGQLLPLDTRGTFVVTVKAPERYWVQESKLLVVTDLALSCRYAGTEALVRVNGLSDARPRAGVKVQVLSTKNMVLAEGLTNADGLVHFRELPWNEQRQPGALVATAGDDCAFLPLAAGVLEQEDLVVGDRPYLQRGYEALVYSDRGICRPGESIRLNAVIRDTKRLAPTPFPVVFAVTDPRGQPLVDLTAMPDVNGLATTELALGEYALTGRYTVALRLPAGDPSGDDKALGSSQFQVESYMPDRMEVSFLDLPSGRVTPADFRTVGVQARYLHGAPVAGATLTLTGTVRSAPIVQPRWPGFRFGDATATVAPVTLPLGERPLDADGLAQVPIRIPAAFGGGEGAVLELRASVSEAGGRAVSRTVSLPLDFQSVMLGVYEPTDGLSLGTEHRLPCVAVTPDGETVGEIAVRATLLRHDWTSVVQHDEDGRSRFVSQSELVEVASVPLTLVAGRGVVPVTVERWGRYTLRLESGQAQTTAVSFYAGGNGDDAGDMRAPHRVDVTLAGDASQPTSHARLRVRAPFTGTALVTVESDTIHWYGLRELATRSSVIEVPLPTVDRPPNVYVTVAVLRPGGPTHDWAGYRAYGAVSVPLPSMAPELTASLDVPAELRPGRELPVAVRVSAGDAPAAGASVTLAVVDTGILNLTNYRAPNPYAFALAPRRMILQYSDLYDLLLPEPRPQQVGVDREVGGGYRDSLAKAERYMNPVSVRRVRSVAWSRADLVTDSRGVVRTTVAVPADFTGQLRVMAVAVSPESGGMATADVIVREPFMAELHLPRVLAPGDRFDATLVLRNDTDKQGLAALELVLDGMELVAPAPVDAELRAGESQVLRLSMRALERIGPASCTLRAKLHGERLERRVELVVRPAGPLLTDWGTGMAKPGTPLHLAPPADWLPGTVHRQYVASADPMLQLGGGLEYLLRYPYGCLEQTSSTVVAMLYLPDLTGRLDPQLADMSRHREYVQAGVDRILSMQLPDGSFSMWPGGNVTWDWGTIWATQILQEASAAGFAIPPARLDAARGFLAAMRGEDDERAAAAWVLLQRPGTDPAMIKSLLESVRPTRDSIGALYLLAARTMMQEATDVTAAVDALLAASDDRPRQTGGMLDSQTRRESLMLLTLMRFAPDHAALDRLAWRLSGRARARGHWGTTQDNGMALMALGKYLRAQGRPSGDSTVDFSVGGRSVARGAASTLGLVTCRGDDDMDLTVQGESPVYYAWVQTGVSATPPPPVDAQLTVRRRYLNTDLEPVDLATVQQGQLLVVDLSVRAHAMTPNVVITDLLPAGLEIENPRLATRSGTFATLPKSLTPDHVDMRDDRLLLFLPVLDVEQHYYYVVRAVTAGEFAVAPVTAECMYDPDIRSLHGGGKLRVVRHD